MSDLFSLKNRIALVTGASRGLGRDMALCLAEAGATVLCAGRALKDLEITVRAIKKKKGKGEAVILDVTDEQSIRKQVRALIRKHRRIDILVNNAGVIHRELIVDLATADYRKVIETDLIGPFALAREVGRHMLARQYGRIVNISSIMAVLGRGTVAGYVSAKHGMTGLTKNLAAEFGPHVTANAIAPGYIRTELNVALQKDKAFNAMLEQRTAAHRWGTPQDLRGALLLLASDLADWLDEHGANRDSLSAWESHCFALVLTFLRYGYYDRALDQIAFILEPPTPLPIFPMHHLLSLEQLMRSLPPGVRERRRRRRVEAHSDEGADPSD